ncbi:hypothetical protein PMIN06_000472 [Paraphaeosphaeria minitans]|uniref:PHD-type domain-containing protein n=1 Tax=Paraphaeosphaeria minitans TaxID=565426 RepID=A0A9P6GNA2_9PLEO|nr:hypothetical protein PMIN01_03388 [Paraphaeosphaeria minitans]
MAQLTTLQAECEHRQDTPAQDSTNASSDIQVAIGQVIEPQMEVSDSHWSPLVSPAEDVAFDYGTPSFGLYLTFTNPPVPAVTYRVQLNTSLAQAQSDMKLLVANELMNAQARGVAEELKLDIDVRKIEIDNENGALLSYEIVKGTFTEGLFTSIMERDGRVIDGESYTRNLLKKAVQETSIESPKDASPEQDAPTSLASESPRANRIESHLKTSKEQQPTPIALYSPIKKRGRDADDATPPPSKKFRPASPEPTQDPADQEVIYCRCKQPDDGTDMLGCDGEACINGGWVHIDCFPEIQSPPVADDGESMWHCPDCDPTAFEVVKKKTTKKGSAVKSGAVEKKTTQKGTAVKKGAVEEKKKDGKKGSAANKRKLIL